MSPQDLKLVCLGFTKMSTCVNQIFDFNNMRLVGPLMGLTLEKKRVVPVTSQCFASSK
jgi:hypothetical protein